MIARKLLALAALAALASACTDSATPTATIGFRHPAAIAAFRGVTLEDAVNVRPYFAVANAARNDLTILDASNDTPVAAPLALRALVLPFPDRPSLLVSADLGDGKPDLLVAVSAGDTVLQVVETWDRLNAVRSVAGVGSPAVDLAAEVVALTAVPSAPGTARVAAALEGGGIALVTWKRVDGASAIEHVPGPDRATFAFQPVALAAMPDDPSLDGVQTEIFAATRDELAPGVFGVAAISADASLTLRALDARGPTRLVAALRLRERNAASSAPDATAFDGQPAVPRVYAALDASGCGLDRRIDCGIVTLDPAKSTGGDAIPEDAAAVMPYRAPIPIPGTPLALAVAGPPAEPPAADLPQYADSTMRLMGGALEQATTGVGVVASDDGNVYFLDLGRYKLATSGSALTSLGANATAPDHGDAERRLWLQRSDTDAFSTAGAVNAQTDGVFLDVTPGWTRDQAFTVTYQGALPELAARGAEVGGISDELLWLALQLRQPTGLTQVVKVYHPAFGIHAGLDGDIAQLAASPLGCVDAAGAALPHLEARIDELLAPTAEYPGGALRLVRPPVEEPVQRACFDALRALVPGSTSVSPPLTATIRARDLVLRGSTLGYAGRPVRGERFEALRYPVVDELGAPRDEDTLAASCPLADWDGSFPVPAAALTCGVSPCNERATCELLVLARKSRRRHHGYESCALATDATRAQCVTVSGDPVAAAGPALAFQVAVEPEATGGDAAPVRDLQLTIQTSSGVLPLVGRATGSPYLATGAVAFDRSSVDAGAGYRFLVSYGADLVLDVTPHVNPVQATSVR